MNKLVLALATVATLGLGTAAFAQSLQSKAPVAHNMQATHRKEVKKVVVVHRGSLHRGTLHHGNKVVTKHIAVKHRGNRHMAVKHMATHKTVRTKASS